MLEFTEFCAVKDGKAYCGGTADIVHSVCDYIKIGEDGKLAYKVKGYEEDSRMSFSGDFSRIAMQLAAIKHIWDKLEQWYGFTIYTRKI